VKATDTPSIRFARTDDFAWCISHDTHVAPEVIERKIRLIEIVVAELDGQLIGCLRLQYLWSKIPFIEVIFVEDAHQRQGMGRAMVAFLEGYLRSQGHTLLLSSSQVDEPQAQAWHRAVGFQEFGILAGLNDGNIGEVFFRKALV
jgi:GNAT superfamily N-acetyltransferase